MIGFEQDRKLVYKHMGTDSIDVYSFIKKYLSERSLRSVRATYDNDNWAIDVSCENGLAYVVILNCKSGTTYTFLNPSFVHLFEKLSLIDPGEFNILICNDASAFEENKDNAKALELFEINGNECPLLHICEDEEILQKIITCFLENGTRLAEANWLKAPQ